MSFSCWERKQINIPHASTDTANLIQLLIQSHLLHIAMDFDFIQNLGSRVLELNVPSSLTPCIYHIRTVHAQEMKMGRGLYRDLIWTRRKPISRDPAKTPLDHLYDHQYRILGHKSRYIKCNSRLQAPVYQNPWLNNCTRVIKKLPQRPG